LPCMQWSIGSGGSHFSGVSLEAGITFTGCIIDAFYII
jgi:hypothetical protein